MTILGGSPGSRKICCFWGHFSKWIFAEGRSTRSLWCPEQIQGPIWRSKDHLVMKGLSKNVKDHEFQRFHYSVRQEIGHARSISTQNMFPLSSVTPKPPESQSTHHGSWSTFDYCRQISIVFRRAPFPNFEISKCPDVRFVTRRLENLVLTHRRKINVLWGDPGQNGRFRWPFLIHWSSNISENHEIDLPDVW